jgi:hypothetical protein
MIQLLVSHSDPRVINLRFHDYNLSKDMNHISLKYKKSYLSN